MNNDTAKKATTDTHDTTLNACGPLGLLLAETSVIEKSSLSSFALRPFLLEVTTFSAFSFLAFSFFLISSLY